MNSSRFPSGSRTYTLDASVPAAALTRDRTLFDRRARFVEPGAQRLRRAVPHEAEIAARRPRVRRAQREALALPRRGPMEVDHLVTDVDRDHVRLLRDVEAERAVERDHRVGVLHRQRHMIESGDLTRRATHTGTRTSGRSWWR